MLPYASPSSHPLEACVVLVGDRNPPLWATFEVVPQKPLTVGFLEPNSVHVFSYLTLCFWDHQNHIAKYIIQIIWVTAKIWIKKLKSIRPFVILIIECPQTDWCDIFLVVCLACVCLPFARRSAQSVASLTVVFEKIKAILKNCSERLFAGPDPISRDIGSLYRKSSRIYGVNISNFSLFLGHLLMINKIHIISYVL